MVSDLIFVDLIFRLHCKKDAIFYQLAKEIRMNEVCMKKLNYRLELSGTGVVLQSGIFLIFRQLATGHSKFFCFLFNSVYYYWLALLRAGEKLISEKWPLQLVSVSSGKIASILTSEPREDPSGTNQAFHQPHSKENRLTNRAGLRPRCLETGRKVESFSGLFMRNKKRSGTKKRACECDKRGRLFKSQGGNKPI